MTNPTLMILPPLISRPLLAGSECELGFIEASPSESLHFLRSISGQWYDALQVGVLEDNEVIHDGFTAGPEGFIPSRFSVFEDGELLKVTKSMIIPTTAKIGLEDFDGFRMILLDLPTSSTSTASSCVLYAVKSTPGESLLVRGPITYLKQSTAHSLRIHYRFHNSGPENSPTISQTAALRDP